MRATPIVPSFVCKKIGAECGVWYEVDRAHTMCNVISWARTNIANPCAPNNAARNAASEHVNHVTKESRERYALILTPNCGVLYEEIGRANAEISADVWIAARCVPDDDA